MTTNDMYAYEAVNKVMTSVEGLSLSHSSIEDVDY